MASELEQLEENKVRLKISVEPDTFEEGLKKAYLKNRSKFAVPGFRKGKVPRPVVEQYYGVEVLYEDAFDAVFAETYPPALKENEVNPVSRPDLNIEKIGKGDGVVYTAEMFTKPAVKLGRYKGIKAEKIVNKIGAKEVNAEIDKARERAARWVDFDGPAKKGDRVELDYSGTVDGETFEGGTAENQTLELGSGRFIPGFEEQMEGMKKGDEKDIDITFPEAYHVESLKGKPAVFHVKVNGVKRKELPEVDDEFIKDVSEFDTLAEYKKNIKKQLQKTADDEAKTRTENNVIAAVVEKADVNIPDVMVENQIDYQVQQMEYTLMYQGVKMEDYLKYTGATMPDIRAQYKDAAYNTVKTQLVLEAVKDKEDISVEEADLEDELKKNAESRKTGLEEYKKSLKPQDLEYMRDKLAYDKTVRFLMDNAELSEKLPDTEKEDGKEKKTSDEKQDNGTDSAK